MLIKYVIVVRDPTEKIADTVLLCVSSHHQPRLTTTRYKVQY